MAIKHPYEYSDGYLFIDDILPELPMHVQVGDMGFVLKTSFHTTLVCVKDIERIIKGDWSIDLPSKEVEEKALKVFENFIKEQKVD